MRDNGALSGHPTGEVNLMSGKELPLGFGMALAQNEKAMQEFEAMTDFEKNAVLQWAHNVGSKQEMRQLVDNIAGGNVQNFYPNKS